MCCDKMIYNYIFCVHSGVYIFLFGPPPPRGGGKYDKEKKKEKKVHISYPIDKKYDTYFPPN